MSSETDRSRKGGASELNSYHLEHSTQGLLQYNTHALYPPSEKDAILLVLYTTGIRLLLSHMTRSTGARSLARSHLTFTVKVLKRNLYHYLYLQVLEGVTVHCTAWIWVCL